MEFVKTLYLGDRACKSILIDGWCRRVCVQVDEISRIRHGDGEWHFYTEEDIKDGLIVFSGVKTVSFTPPGPIPNDYIVDFSVARADDSGEGAAEGKFVFTFSIGSVCDANPPQEVVLRIVASDVHLEDPCRPGLVITE
jgi:hypothetical protein